MHESSSFSGSVGAGQHPAGLKRQNKLANLAASGPAPVINRGRSVGAASVAGSLTGVQTSSSPGGRQPSGVESNEESLMRTYAASSFDDYEVQGDWQDRVLTPEKEVSWTPFASFSKGDSPLPDETAQLLKARTALLRWQKSQKTKKDEPAPARQKNRRYRAGAADHRGRSRAAAPTRRRPGRASEKSAT